MTPDVQFLLLLAVIALLFITELIPLAVTSIACAYATPVGTPPNTLVLGPGGYRFMDYVKVGTPLIFVSFIVSMIVIPIVWPFFK